ncbi:MAG TPA: hypothetical protein VIG34_11015 [Xanthobacteraceae bacterium]|jgi:hypothetical protein
MLRKFLAAFTAFALIAAFSLAAISPADAAKRRARAAKPAPATAAQCVTDILFFPVALAIKKRVC